MNDYEWIFKCDLDAFILNPSIRLENIIAEAYGKFEYERNNKDLHFIFNQDCGGLNAGQFLIKNSKISAELLTKAYESKDDTNIQDVYYFYEQAVIKHILKYDEFFSTKNVFIDQFLINSYPDNRCGTVYEKGDFLAHWAGSKHTIMDWVNNIDYSNSLWTKNKIKIDYRKQEWKKSYLV